MVRGHPRRSRGKNRSNSQSKALTENSSSPLAALDVLCVVCSVSCLHEDWLNPPFHPLARESPFFLSTSSWPSQFLFTFLTDAGAKHLFHTVTAFPSFLVRFFFFHLSVHGREGRSCTSLGEFSIHVFRLTLGNVGAFDV